MKKTLLLCLFCLCIVAFAACAPAEETKFLTENEDYLDLSAQYDGVSFEYDPSLWYMNQLQDVPLPDPFVYEEAGLYYIVGTNDRDVNTVDCYVTADFSSYEVHRDIFVPAQYGGWENAQPEIYAPEIYCFDGVYYLYYSANDKASVRRCSVAVADNPLGPYEPLVTDEVDGLHNPLFQHEDHPERALDATVFTDEDGKRYLHFTVTADTQHIVGVELLSPYEADWSTYTRLVVPGRLDSNGEETVLEWEVYRENRIKIAEAPFMLKSGGKYYLTYSVNGCWNKYYNVCYAVSDNPLGNFVKPYEEGKLWTNLLLGYPGTNDRESSLYQQWDGFASGTGHHCFFYAGQDLMIGYHAHQSRACDEKSYTPRYFAFDYVHFDEDGRPFCNGPTWSLLPLPEGISGVRNVAGGAGVTGEHVRYPENATDNNIVDYCTLDSREQEVILDAGDSWLEITLDRVYEISAIVIYNSAYYDSYIPEIEYIDFGNGSILYYPQFCEDFYVNAEKAFIYPNSCFNIELLQPLEAQHIKIGFHLPQGGSINEVVILGK